MTISAEHLGIVVLRSYAKSEVTIKRIPISPGTQRILGVALDDMKPSLVAVLCEDQSVVIWDMDLEKALEKFKAEGTHLTNIKWNPYDPNEIICFSEGEIFCMKRDKPDSGVTLLIPVPISNISFIPQMHNCTPISHQ